MLPQTTISSSESVRVVCKRQKEKQTLETRTQSYTTHSRLPFCSPPGIQALRGTAVAWLRLHPCPLAGPTDPQRGVCRSCGDLASASVVPKLPCPRSASLARLAAADSPAHRVLGARGAEHGESAAAQSTRVARGKPGRRGRCVLATHSAWNADVQMSPGPSRLPEDLLHLRPASDSANSQNQRPLDGGRLGRRGRFGSSTTVFLPRPPRPNQLRAS